MSSLLKTLKDAIVEWTDYLIAAFQCYFRRSRRKGAAAAAAAAHRSANPDKENLVSVGGIVGGAGTSRINNNKLSGSSNGSSNSVASNGSIVKSHSAEFTSVCDTLHEADFDRLIAMPAIGVDNREWMASHLLAFFHHVNALYGTVSELCTVDTCPVMNGPGNTQIPWVDEKGKKCKYSAPQYVDCVMSFIEKIVRSEDSFPTKFGHNFPTNFDSTVKKLCRFLYHVLGHLHIMHWRELAALGVGSQAQAVGRHFASFVKHYGFLDSKETLALIELLNEWRISPPDPPSTGDPMDASVSDQRQPSCASDIQISMDNVSQQQQQQMKLTALQVISNSDEKDQETQ